MNTYCITEKKTFMELDVLASMIISSQKMMQKQEKRND